MHRLCHENFRILENNLNVYSNSYIQKLLPKVLSDSKSDQKGIPKSLTVEDKNMNH